MAIRNNLRHRLVNRTAEYPKTMQENILKEFDAYMEFLGMRDYLYRYPKKKRFIESRLKPLASYESRVERFMYICKMFEHIGEDISSLEYIVDFN